MKTIEAFLEHYFSLVTAKDRPFPWQRKLFERFCRLEFPECAALPTGGGKTTVMSLWVLALGLRAQVDPENVRVPRRLVWVVDRRVVVDQATKEAEGLSERLASNPELLDLRESLGRLSVSHEPLAVSTLRGEFADNRKWSDDPSGPAIIVGTVDMIGSRLLFSGYGVSRRRRAYHAALLAQDTLIVNDEAHLTPAFAALVGQIQHETKGDRPMRFLTLSATQRNRDKGTRFPENLDADLTESEEFRKRYQAVKRLHLHQEADPRKAIQSLAIKPDRRTIVFVRSPANAKTIAKRIEREYKHVHVPLLTGAQRGKERDELPDDPVFQRFTAETPSHGEGPCWLVATSAGEVGVNLSCDRLITDLDTADHLLQRFGRLNRFGETQGDAHVIYSKKQLLDKAKGTRWKATLQYLGGLPDVSPQSLSDGPPPLEAWSPEPRLAPLLPWHIDVWSMTSLTAKDWPSRPAVQQWLHGDDEEGAPPETYVCWRSDIEDLCRQEVSNRDREEVFSFYRVLAKERLKSYTDLLCKDLEKSPHLARQALLIGRDGQIDVATIQNLISDRFRTRLLYATIVFPPGVGRIDLNGMVNWSEEVRPDEPGWELFDISSVEGTRQKERLGPEDQESRPPNLRKRWHIPLSGVDETEKGSRWVYYTVPQKKDESESSALDKHQAEVAENATKLAACLGLPSDLAQVLRWAGYHHDLGKNREAWQRAACNADLSRPLAKSKEFYPKRLAGYRHELGSLLDAQTEIPKHFSAEQRELALHLIATHHGWARPHFPRDKFDKQNVLRSEQAALESARRFGLLQQRYGAWRLAYVETLLRAADAIASRETTERPNA